MILSVQIFRKIADSAGNQSAFSSHISTVVYLIVLSYKCRFTASLVQFRRYPVVSTYPVEDVKSCCSCRVRLVVPRPTPQFIYCILSLYTAVLFCGTLPLVAYSNSPFITSTVETAKHTTYFHITNNASTIIRRSTVVMSCWTVDIRSASDRCTFSDI